MISDTRLLSMPTQLGCYATLPGTGPLGAIYYG
jgi:hypothetical protein